MCINFYIAGIALENQSKMFNEFMQFNRNTLQGGGGSGLGLWICKNLAVLHGGRLVERPIVLPMCLRDINRSVMVRLGFPFGWRRHGVYFCCGASNLL